MSAPRACLTCEHFQLDMGEPGYSELTPGSPASITCNLQGTRGCAWPRHDPDDASPLTLRSIAERCERYQLHHDLSPGERNDE